MANKPLSGLQRLCKLYGGMKVGHIMYVWDYVNDVAVPEKEMKSGSKRWKASEKKKWEAINPPSQTR